MSLLRTPHLNHVINELITEILVSTEALFLLSAWLEGERRLMVMQHCPCTKVKQDSMKRSSPPASMKRWQSLPTLTPATPLANPTLQCAVCLGRKIAKLLCLNPFLTCKLPRGQCPLWVGHLCPAGPCDGIPHIWRQAGVRHFC